MAGKWQQAEHHHTRHSEPPHKPGELENPSHPPSFRTIFGGKLPIEGVSTPPNDGRQTKKRWLI
jgi:hypothetical protein